MKHWLRNSLKPMMLDLLSKASLQKHGYFDHQVVTQWIQEHLDGRVNHSHRLWALMVFEMRLQPTHHVGHAIELTEKGRK